VLPIWESILCVCVFVCVCVCVYERNFVISFYKPFLFLLQWNITQMLVKRVKNELGSPKKTWYNFVWWLPHVCVFVTKLIVSESLIVNCWDGVHTNGKTLQGIFFTVLFPWPGMSACEELQITLGTVYGFQKVCALPWKHLENNDAVYKLRNCLQGSQLWAGVYSCTL
jgi:hypothetical protein